MTRTRTLTLTRFHRNRCLITQPVGVGREGISSMCNSDSLQMYEWGYRCVCLCVQETRFSSTCFTLAHLIKEEE